MGFQTTFRLPPALRDWRCAKWYQAAAVSLGLAAVSAATDPKPLPLARPMVTVSRLIATGSAEPWQRPVGRLEPPPIEAGPSAT